ncbi:MAG TPA: TIGR00730 family Rossman fold protein [Polyangiales bacterium]
MRIAVFCGSSPGRDPSYLEQAAAFGRLLATRDVELVYGGAHVGLMGALADAVLAHGGRAIGVIPDSLVAREVAHRGLSELHVVASMHERKAMMADLSDAFVALPGGIGTLEELFEVWTWNQLGLHNKPCALLDINGFYAGLAGFLDHVVDQGFLKPAQRAALLRASDAEALLRALTLYDAPAPQPVIDPTAT